jgi:hypothetical protein
MTETTLPIVLGIICGLLSAFLLFALARFWSDTVLPLTRRWRYQGVTISGEWKGLGTGVTAANGEWTEITVTLDQDAADLVGLMIIRYRSEIHSFDLNLRLAGRIREGYATLNLAPVSRGVASVATALLKIDNDGLALNGQLLYRDAFVDSVDIIHLSVHRADSIAVPRLVPAGAIRAGGVVEA